MPSSWSNYGDVEYWNERYERDTLPFEWYQEYNGIRHLLTPEYLFSGKKGTGSPRDIINHNDSSQEENNIPLKDKCRVLIIGCGSSHLGEDMLKDGWTGGIDNVDFSKVVIDQMKKRCNDAMYRQIQAKLNREKREMEVQNQQKQNSSSDRVPSKERKGHSPRKPKPVKPIQRMTFECVDVTESIPFPDSTFDIILNKGTLDAILCSNGAIPNSKRMMKECCRVLKSHGSMVVVTYGKPENRLVYFENEEKEWWTGGVKNYKVTKPQIQTATTAGTSKYHNVYILSK